MTESEDRPENCAASTKSACCDLCVGSGEIFLCSTWMRTSGECCPAGTIRKGCPGRTVPCECNMSFAPDAVFSSGCQSGDAQSSQADSLAGRYISPNQISRWSGNAIAKARGLISGWPPRRSFGRKGMPVVENGPLLVKVFGRRKQVPDKTVSLQQIRVKLLYAQLVGMFGDELEEESGPPFIYAEEPVPCLRMAGGAVVSIDEETGHYTMRDASKSMPSAFVTGSEERIIDHIISYLCASSNAHTSQTADAAVKLLVGHSIAEVEQRLIMQTMRFCAGDRYSAARLLGLSLVDLRERLRSYSLQQVLR